MTWHVLDAGSVWMKEFAASLSGFVPTVSWSPVIQWAGLAGSWEHEEQLADPALTVRHFPLQRGYHRFPISILVQLGRAQTKRMLRFGENARQSPLVCTTPYYAPVAERWPGPVVYYQTDLTIGYQGLDANQIRSLDRRLCRVATAVCPNSQRVGDYLVNEAFCDARKIVIVPNATREENILSQAPSGPGSLPHDLADLPRPVIGVLGNLAANLDWRLLQEAVEGTPDYSWAFVGPFSMDIPDPLHRRARESLLNSKRRVRFVGPKPYGLLQEYARAIDAAVLPYRRKEPTFSGSSTRFYEHLAACRPMLSTRGFEELLHKEPLLRLFDTAAELTALLKELARVEFRDGFETARWQASQNGTWSMRAVTLMSALQARWQGEIGQSALSKSWASRVEQSEFVPNAHGDFALMAAE